MEPAHVDRAAEQMITCVSVQSVFRATPWVLEPHARGDHHQFVWINKGAGRVQIDGLTRGFAPNSAFFFPAGTIFGFELTATVSGWWVRLPISIPPALPLADSPVQLMVAAREDQAALAALCDDLNRECGSDKIGAEAACGCYAGLLSVWLARKAARSEQKPSKQQQLMRAFMRRLETRFASEDTASAFAGALDVTTTHLARVCRQACGKSATEIIQDRKLFAAKMRLAQSPDRVGSIGRQCGFGSAAYFTRVFTNRTGITPREFRRRAEREREPRQRAERELPPAISPG